MLIRMFRKLQQMGTAIVSRRPGAPEELDPTLPEIRVGVPETRPTAATVRIAGNDSQWVRLRGRLRVKTVQVCAMSNDNQRFVIRVGLGKLRRTTRVYLGFEGLWWSGGLGTSKLGSEAIFEVDRASALRIAGACAVVARERSALDAGLRYAWSFPEEVTSSEADAVMSLRIDNVSTATVQLMYCPYAFAFEATCDGAPLVTNVQIYSGPSAFARIQPGEHQIVSADLRTWIGLDQPGRYQISARFDGQVEPDGMSMIDAHSNAAVWDVTATGQGVVLVR